MDFRFSFCTTYIFVIILAQFGEIYIHLLDFNFENNKAPIVRTIYKPTIKYTCSIWVVASQYIISMVPIVKPIIAKIVNIKEELVRL